jgi:hypothetical protein
MKGIKQLLVAALYVLGPMPQVLADPFFGGPDSSSSKFHGEFDDFARSLSGTGQHMRDSYEFSASQQVQRNFADQQSSQQGTQAMSQQEFQKGLMQAQASGGLYNGNQGGFINNGGLFGSGIGAGGFGIAGAQNNNANQAEYGSANQPQSQMPAYGMNQGIASNQQPVSNDGFFSNNFGGNGLFGERSEPSWQNKRRTVDPNWREPVSTLHEHKPSSSDPFSLSNSSSGTSINTPNNWLNTNK